MKKNFQILSLCIGALCIWADASSVYAQSSVRQSDLVPASFDDISVGSNGLYRSDNPTENGQQQWESGSFIFTTFVDAAYAPNYYYYDVTVSSKTGSDFVMDYSDGFDMKSSAGGAAQGDNFAVWYNNFYGNAYVLMKETSVVFGMYVSNNSYAYSSILNGDGYAKKFTTGDWFKLTVWGGTQGAGGIVLKDSVEFYLADFREEGNWKIAERWSWLNLRRLGEINVIAFSLSSSDSGAFGMNTPAYFCFDELCGAEPEFPHIDYTIVNEGTGIESLRSIDICGGHHLPDKSARKLMIDGKIYIRSRNDHLQGL